MAPPEVYDAFGERQSRLLWVGDSDVVLYPAVRAAKLERRAAAMAAESAMGPSTSTKDWWGRDRPLLTYNRAAYDEEERLKQKAQRSPGLHVREHLSLMCKSCLMTRIPLQENQLSCQIREALHP